MNKVELFRRRLRLIEAQLFAIADPSVANAVETSVDEVEAIHRLIELGFTEAEAQAVLDIPLRHRTLGYRDKLALDAQQLRTQLCQINASAATQQTNEQS